MIQKINHNILVMSFMFIVIFGSLRHNIHNLCEQGDVIKCIVYYPEYRKILLCAIGQWSVVSASTAHTFLFIALKARAKRNRATVYIQSKLNVGNAASIEP